MFVRKIETENPFTAGQLLTVFLILTSNRVDKPFLNIFRVFGMMEGNRAAQRPTDTASAKRTATVTLYRKNGFSAETKSGSNCRTGKSGNAANGK